MSSIKMMCMSRSHLPNMPRADRWCDPASSKNKTYPTFHFYPTAKNKNAKFRNSHNSYYTKHFYYVNWYLQKRNECSIKRRKKTKKEGDAEIQNGPCYKRKNSRWSLQCILRGTPKTSPHSPARQETVKDRNLTTCNLLYRLPKPRSRCLGYFQSQQTFLLLHVLSWTTIEKCRRILLIFYSLTHVNI